jgi:hypothetical protein
MGVAEIVGALAPVLVWWLQEKVRGRGREKR